MGGLCFVVVPGEVAVNLEAPEEFSPMIRTVPSVPPIAQDFDKMRDLLNQGLLQMIQESQE
jgi:hypothetical protein